MQLARSSRTRLPHLSRFLRKVGTTNVRSAALALDLAVDIARRGSDTPVRRLCL